MGVGGTAVPKCKGLPLALERKAKRVAREDAEDAFRDLIWDRDKGIDRADGRRLTRNAADPDVRGEVHHVATVGAHPARKYDPTNALLLSYTNNCLADGRGGRVLDIGDEDCNGPVTITRREYGTGKVLWRRTSRPPGMGSGVPARAGE